MFTEALPRPARNLRTAYYGSGPYCYSNSLAMMLGAEAPSAAIVETATGSAFGMQLVDGLPYFDPYGWTPELGLDAALSHLGWSAMLTHGGAPAEAIARLRSHLVDGPVLVGPVDMGFLRHLPGTTQPVGADHYLIALAVDDEGVIAHDPEGHPFSHIALPDFLEAWEARGMDYGHPFSMRAEFVRRARPSEAESIARSIRASRRWLHVDPPVEDGLANADAAFALAALLERGPDEEVREHLVQFAIRVGARRLSDAAGCMLRIGLDDAADVMLAQARLVGRLQHAVVTGRFDDGAEALRRLAPTYGELRLRLERSGFGRGV
ncbi:hypothetical protein [Microbacterium sp. MYb62]|uniref:hypothetical protein n=1 Tax=Microbacterium sp. MYb62 TaxID=1848690 RepID=UPI000CFDD19B|nr:hypothetical protein [Microbacterium sp. MYb62]PRB14128.1 hypothetical protein CQ042_11615 [Microbacterium sp. MYb62]